MRGTLRPFGARVAIRQARAQQRAGQWSRTIWACCVGSGDLHGLVRCPPLARRWRTTPGWIGDLGCGAGWFHLEVLLGRTGGGPVLGMDTDFEALRTARALAATCGLADRVRYVCGSVTQVPFRDGAFEQLFLVDVIEHVPDDAAVVRESVRVLKSRGRLELSTPTPWYPRVFGARTHEGVGHVRPGYTLQEIRRRLETAGLTVRVARQNTGGLLWPWMGVWYRVAWDGLWVGAPKRPLQKAPYHLLLLVLSLLVQAGRWVDLVGGYCSNDLEAEKR